MKPILYGPNETAFDTNGIGVLADAVACRVVEGLNGQYELTLRYPITGIHYNQLIRRAIILAKPNPVSKPQPFRIYRRAPSSQGTIVVYARHIAYDLTGIVVAPFRAAGAQAAMQALGDNAVTDCPFTFWTDKSTAATLSPSVPTDIWSLLGGSEGSVLDQFGGEYEFDRFDVRLWNRRGADRGVSIRYGKNLTSLEQDENCAKCYTGVYPYWQGMDGALVQLPEKILAAPGVYDHVRIKPVDFSQEWIDAPTEAQLRARAERYVTENQIGVPNVSWTVKHVDLSQTEEYKNTAILEQVLLGDTVSVDFADMDVSASSRVVATDFDVLLEIYNSTTLGRVKANIADTVYEQAQELQSKPSATMVQRITMALTAAITGAKGGAVRLLDTDGDGMPDELYIADHEDPAQAVKVWRWNYEGWAASKEGYNGPFVLGATLEDGILSHAITAANLIAGTIKSADNGKTFFLDLDNGILNMKATEFSVSGKTVDEIAKDQVDAQTQQDIFSKLTGNGEAQGIYLKDGKVYINASYLASGIIDAAVVQVVNLVAEKLSSVNGQSALGVSGAELQMTYDGKETFYVNNEYGNRAQLGFRVFDKGGNLEQAGYFNARQVEFGGPGVGDRMYIGVDTTTMQPYMILPNDPYKMLTLSWKDNGNGTFNLIGREHPGETNPGKAKLFTGNVTMGKTCTVPNTDLYDLFAIKLWDGATTYDTMVLAYKTGNVVRGVGGWAGTATESKQLFFFSATISGNTWKLEDAGFHYVYIGGGVEEGIRLNLKEVIGVI